VKARSLVVTLLAFWLALGPAASVLAQSADTPCESMSMSTPADDCCGEGVDLGKCLSACLAVAPAINAPAGQAAAPDVAFSVVDTLSFRHASILAPPDIAPPKSFLS
jgi:hypothetical protein